MAGKSIKNSYRLYKLKQLKNRNKFFISNVETHYTYYPGPYFSSQKLSNKKYNFVLSWFNFFMMLMVAMCIVFCIIVIISLV